MKREFKNVITITRNAAPTKDAGGGLNKGTSTTWTKWAKVENRSGDFVLDRTQRDWNYTYKITVRYDAANVERNGDTITHGSLRLQVREVSFQDEGERRLVILRCSTIE